MKKKKKLLLVEKWKEFNAQYIETLEREIKKDGKSQRKKCPNYDKNVSQCSLIKAPIMIKKFIMLTDGT